MENSSTGKINKPIVLVGMMGVGKTTYGKKAASILKTQFVDVDQMIENEIGHSISWIFENVGEQQFRHTEENKIKELISENLPIIIALGGGAFLNSNTRSLIKDKAISVWLKSSAETIFNRVSMRKDRPLLEGVEDKLGKIKDLIKAREEYYKQADISVDTENGNQRDVAQKIISAVEKFIARK